MNKPTQILVYCNNYRCDGKSAIDLSERQAYFITHPEDEETTMEYPYSCKECGRETRFVKCAPRKEKIFWSTLSGEKAIRFGCTDYAAGTILSEEEGE